ncbi:MAG: cell wall hydrolase [Firmicutes bacterium]|nr:cell wall hydrolase [Bacillota bacterium]
MGVLRWRLAGAGSRWLLAFLAVVTVLSGVLIPTRPTSSTPVLTALAVRINRPQPAADAPPAPPAAKAPAHPTPAATAPNPSPARPAPAPPATFGYQIQPGDTLWSLAQQFHTTVSALMQINHLTGSLIVAGEQLQIPIALNPAPTLPSRGLPVAANPQRILLLAHLVQAEAGNQPFLGRVAVAAVALNRLKHPGFPKTLRGVIFQPGQFDSVSNGSFYQMPDPRSLAAAEMALAGWDPTGGALYFYNPSLTDDPWIRTRPVVVQIGDQRFCR